MKISGLPDQAPAGEMRVCCMDIFDLYKPLRNYLRDINLQGLLVLLWRVQLGHEDSAVIPLRQPNGAANGEAYRWDFHLLAREALLNASQGATSRQPVLNDVFVLLNHIRRISNETTRRTISSGQSALESTHQLIHQQARWQNSNDWYRLHRIHRVFNRDDVRPLLESVVDVRLSTIYTLTMAIAGAARSRSPATNMATDYTFLGIKDEERDAYFFMMGAPLATIQQKIKEHQQYDERWAFTRNSLEETPLIQLRSDRPNEYLCPQPDLLIRRATDSLFFDLGKSKGFENPYGAAFEAYVGEVLHEQFVQPTHRVVGERKYMVGKRMQKHGVDWIVSDPTGHLMLECKTRRLRVDAKSAADSDILTQSVGQLAEVVVQHYKNVHDAMQGKTQWIPDGRPIYPFVVTFDDWYLFAPHVVGRVEELVRQALAKIGLESLLASSPFIVTSIAEFEAAGQAIAQIGIDRFCSSRVKLEFRHFDLCSHAMTAFPDEEIGYRRLFERSDEEMFGHMMHLIRLPGVAERQG